MNTVWPSYKNAFAKADESKCVITKLLINLSFRLNQREREPRNVGALSTHRKEAK